MKQKENLNSNWKKTHREGINRKIATSTTGKKVNEWNSIASGTNG
jgi:hypothetical protein